MRNPSEAEHLAQALNAYEGDNWAQDVLAVYELVDDDRTRAAGYEPEDMGSSPVVCHDGSVLTWDERRRSWICDGQDRHVTDVAVIGWARLHLHKLPVSSSVASSVGNYVNLWMSGKDRMVHTNSHELPTYQIRVCGAQIVIDVLSDRPDRCVRRLFVPAVERVTVSIVDESD